MKFKPSVLSILFLLLFTITAQAQPAKQVLLNGIDSLAMPAAPHGSSFFITVDEQPEVIATLRSELMGQVFRANAIVVSHFGKGKVV